MSLAVVPIERLSFVFEPAPWRFADERRAEIDAHFAQRSAGNSQIWNGRVVLAHGYEVDGRNLAGTCFETDFASFLAWRDWGFPDVAAVNCFSMGALRGSDGAFLLGVMSAGTANAGRIYFPAGTPEPADVVDGHLDLAGNVVREVAEETGLEAADYTADAGWHAVPAGPRLALMKLLTADVPARELQERIRGFIGREKNSELADIRIVRAPADFDPMMPPFVTAFLSHALSSRV
jgi:8-oxo-dGTP pyrophosphatase MutT (NUDIX family)